MVIKSWNQDLISEACKFVFCILCFDINYVIQFPCSLAHVCGVNYVTASLKDKMGQYLL